MNDYNLIGQTVYHPNYQDINRTVWHFKLGLCAIIALRMMKGHPQSTGLSFGWNKRGAAD
jgi:hypothetical protein